MPRNEDTVRLRHMLDAARKAVQFAQRQSRADLDEDEMLSFALMRLLEVLGEAAKGVSPSLRQNCLSIAWAEIARTRDRLIHGYFDVDLDIVWQIVTHDLSPINC